MAFWILALNVTVLLTFMGPVPRTWLIVMHVSGALLSFWLMKATYNGEM